MMVSEKVGDVKIKDIPTNFEEYVEYRYGLKAAILAISRNVLEIKRYLADLDDPTKSNQDLLNYRSVLEEFVDAQVFTALLQAAKSKQALRVMEKVRLEVPFGAGRVAIRVMDRALQYEQKRVSMRATALLMGLKCKDGDNLKKYLQDFRLYRFQMAADPACACALETEPTASK